MITSINLKHLTPVAKGGVRLVFEHPEDPGLLVKVMRPEVVDERYGADMPWYKRKRRYKQYILFVREIREYVAAWASHGEILTFAQKIIGLAETDLGLGLILEAARDRDGKLAPTLATLVDAGRFDSAAQGTLEEFLKGMMESDLILSDLHERNLVYTHCEEGRFRFIIIDGLGDSGILPLRALSRVINRLHKRAKIRRLRKRLILRQSRVKATGGPDHVGPS